MQAALARDADGACDSLTVHIEAATERITDAVFSSPQEHADRR